MYIIATPNYTHTIFGSMLRYILYILGCCDDLEKATKTARSMVVDYGMSDSLGLQYRYNSHESEQGKLSITTEVDRMLKESHTRVTDILTEHKEELDMISAALMLKKTLYAEEIKGLIEDYHSKQAALTKKNISATEDNSSNENKFVLLDDHSPSTSSSNQGNNK